MLVGIALLDINYHQWAVTHHLDHVYSFDLLELLSVPIPLSQQILIFWLMFMGIRLQSAGVPISHLAP
jgi:NADH-quinone oxidoreductase subunit M